MKYHLTPVGRSIIQKNKKQMLARMWRKGNPNTLLVGIYIGAASMENSIEIPQKTKNRTTM